MDCQGVRLLILAHQRGRVDPTARAEIGAHLATCAACAHEDVAERGLTEALEERLPQHAAPLGLKRRLAAEWPAPMARRPWWKIRGWGRAVGAASAVAAALLIAWPIYLREISASRTGAAVMVAEAVNDHLRMLSSQHPLDVESGGMHEVKPWFEGRLDFAPVVSFLGDQEFPLRGGAVGYYLDRKAAIFAFSRRLHTITLIVFRADGLAWPPGTLDTSGDAVGRTEEARGFTVILWRRGELGYALVSDLDRRELTQLAAKLAKGA